MTFAFDFARTLVRSAFGRFVLFVLVSMIGAAGTVQAQQDGSDRAQAEEGAAKRLFPPRKLVALRDPDQAHCARDDDRLLASPFATFRLGIVASPVVGIDGGLDATFPRLGFARNWAARLDLDASARFDSPSFGSTRDAVIALTACQVYSPGGVNRGRYYIGGGIGPSVGHFYGVGGKVFAGINVTRVLSFEIDGQFPGDSSSRVIVLIRGAAL